jgi:lysophospholipase L1-like esterase
MFGVVRQARTGLQVTSSRHVPGPAGPQRHENTHLPWMHNGQVEAGWSGLVYAALGDSMSIDHYAGGPGHGPASLLWRNRDDDFPAWAGQDLTARNPAAHLALLASDGATSTTVVGEQLRQLHRLELVPTLATVTMGGNDLLATYGDATAGRQAIQRVIHNGQRLLASLRALMGPMAPIVVATVYDPSDGTGDAPRLGLPVWPEALDLLAELNQSLRALAKEHRALVADVHGRFLGHGLATGDPAQLDPRPSNRDLWYCGLIEPNAWGASEIRATFWEVLTINGDRGRI